jgi:hypothetical protein
MNLETITTATLACINKAGALYDLAGAPTIIIRPMKSRRALGRCLYTYATRQVVIEFNLTAAASMGDAFADVIPHEVAHAVCFLTGAGKGHDRHWRSVCRMLGGNASRTCNLDAATRVAMSEEPGQRRNRYYILSNAAGVLEYLTGVQHKRRERIQARGDYTFAGTFTGRTLLSPGHPRTLALIKAKAVIDTSMALDAKRTERRRALGLAA